MADHSELVTEMSVVEKMSTQERLKHAKKRRQQQLKKWSQHERELQKAKKGKASSPAVAPPPTEYKVHFVPSVMLLEAAARNDVDEAISEPQGVYCVLSESCGGSHDLANEAALPLSVSSFAYYGCVPWSSRGAPGVLYKIRLVAGRE
ncbi:hypothetical protein HPB51_018462 [Rhipicephalus microplus]|uniref:Uncharacterized protein n=1 Tax=Rhipicephalus microplus TaxID=6941 RepID=A0A9J6DB50_RHIMP|nr:hypothetical protein HPB51_018462 [Rhipicephalus microplus]